MISFRRVILLAAVLLASVKIAAAQAAYGTTNARRLNGIPLSSTAPTNGQTWVYNSTTKQWEPGSGAAGGGVTLQSNGTPQATAPTINVLPGTGVQLLVGGNSTALTLQPVLDAMTGEYSMPAGGCNNNGSGMYTNWGVTPGSINTATCGGPSNTQGVLPFTNTGTPTAYYFFRIPIDWASSGATAFVLREAENSNNSGNVKWNVAVGCQSGAGSAVIGTFSFNTATSVTAAAVASHAIDRTFTPLTMTGCNAGDYAALQLSRDNSTAGNLAGDMWMTYGVLRYTKQ
jgi:hypothetical protein